MRRAIDPKTARLLIHTASEVCCPHCEGPLRICQHRERFIFRLDGVVHHLCRDKRCPDEQCEGYGTWYRPLVDLRLALPRMSFGLDVVVAVGEGHLAQACGQEFGVADPSQGVRGGAGPGLRRTNLVIANAVNLGEERLRHLVDRVGTRLGAPEIQERLFKTLWENLRQVGKLGSLVQVQEGVAQVLAEWVDRQAKQKGLRRPIAEPEKQQLQLGVILSETTQAESRQLEFQRRELEEEASALRRDLLAGIEAAAAEAGSDPAERLFAEDTARGLQLLEVLSRRFDVIVMNPPYGSFVPRVRDFIKAAYQLTKENIYATFIERATQLVEEYGYIGALVSSTFTNLKEFEKLRTEILLKRNPLVLMLDLGFGILDDATVEAAALVLRGGPL